MTVPRPLCQCRVCVQARKFGGKYKRNNSSLYIEDIKTLVDCGEDIADSLNRNNIKEVKNLFITHWHPDHSFGLRALLESGYDFRAGRADKTIAIYIPKNVYRDLLAKFPVIDYLVGFQKTGHLHLIEDGDSIKIGKTVIKAVGHQGKRSHNYAYLISAGKKRALYAPCDTLDFDNFNKIGNLDLLVHECGMFFDHKTEIRFPELIKRLRRNAPKKIILTHIEEIELRLYDKRFKSAKKDYPDVKFDFAFDGMNLEL